MLARQAASVGGGKREEAQCHKGIALRLVSAQRYQRQWIQRHVYFSLPPLLTQVLSADRYEMPP